LGRGKRARGDRRPEHEHLLRLGTDEHYADAPLYDLEYSDRTEDIVFYEGLAQSESAAGGRLEVLELGAGTGRIAVPLARQGHAITALDRAPAMLRALREKLEALNLTAHIEPVEGDMCALPFADDSFDLVISPFNALMHLYTWDELLACLREAHRVLRPGGAFAFDVLLPDLEWLMWEPDARHSVERFVHPTTGEKMTYSTNHTYDPETQVCHIRLYYDRGSRPRPRHEPARLVHLAHRQIFPEEIRVLTAWAGFSIETHGGDFLDLSLSADVESQVVVCRKPAATGS
jgi:SAM-dependent methyltransferase